ncbi:MAG TPA: SUMF1/EgtB/PvdO family nonheme iron enzyme [Caulobacteraceae bacterium]|nr:SUMF1/EgtB/PvdO family nonheme iron enzyme [Caulobacteraceae bacterium]
MSSARIWPHVLVATLLLSSAPAGAQDVAAKPASASAPDPTATDAVVKAVAKDMTAIPAGTFQMGDVQKVGFTFEQPVHQVSVPAFRLAAHDVTFAEYDVFARATGRALPEQRPGFERGSLPVVNVNWVDAQAFIAWLNQASGRHYRLPSEAEWEYAARAGATTLYPWGDRFDPNKANSMGMAGADRWDGPAPVGSFPPNAFGLYDMVGNVGQWVEDRKHNDFSGAPTDGSAWDDGGDPNWRMVRGGSWVMGPKGLRVSLRLWDDIPRRSYQSLGFRIAESNDDSLTPTEAAEQQAAASPSTATPGRRAAPADWYASMQKSQSFATAKLAQSPRRGEWITVQSLGRPLKAWVVYPQTKRKAPVILVLHEVFGLTDSTRNTADEIAAMGYIAIAPDMLSGLGPNGGGTDSFKTGDAGGTLDLREDKDVYKDLEALMDYGDKLPQSDGKVGIVGLTWGGGVAFRYAVTDPRKDVKVVLSFCGAGPPVYGQGPSHMNKLINDWPVHKTHVPVYAFYGEWDLTQANPVLFTAEDSKRLMDAAGNRFEAVVYPRAEHAFLRVGEDPADKNPANAVADKAALIRVRQILKSSFR